MAYTVLIVDDSPTAVPELKALLEGQGYQVLTALRAEEALDTLRTSKVDLVITEALLPGMDGFEFIRHIRRDNNWSQIPIVMLTVRSAAEDYAAGYEAGADEYFLKPVEPPKILAAGRGLITRYEMAKSAPEQNGAMTLRRGAARGAAAAMPSRADRGEIITTFSLKGGVGTSTIAVNLAVAIKQLAPSTRVGLIDLSLEEGLDALLLDIVPTSTIVEWSRESLADATPYMLNQYFTQHRSGISLMAAPASPEQAEVVRADAVRRTLELAPEAFDYVVLDTSSTFNESSLIALEMATSIVLPLTPDMAALKTTVNTTRILKAVKINEDKLRFVLNEIVPRAGLTKEQIDTSLGKETFMVPHAGPSFIEASIHGMPLVTHDPPPPAARAIMDLARTVCEPEFDDMPVARGRVPVLDRLGRLGVRRQQS